MVDIDSFSGDHKGKRGKNRLSMSHVCHSKSFTLSNYHLRRGKNEKPSLSESFYFVIIFYNYHCRRYILVRISGIKVGINIDRVLEDEDREEQRGAFQMGTRDSPWDVRRGY